MRTIRYSARLVTGAAAFGLGTALLLGAAGCATVDKPPEAKPMQVSPEEQKKAQEAAMQPVGKIYRRKVAIGRFSNETNYGRGLLVDADLDPLGKQASDVLATDLERSNRFIIFERPDLSKIEKEQAIAGGGGLVGVDALILGSVTEFGRATEGKSGFLSSTKRQRVRAKVNLRLVEVSTGRVFFAADGVGEAITESGEIAGFGSRAAYDSTLNERAIGAAIGDLLDELVTELSARPWRTYVLAVEDGSVFVSGGERQGLRVGDELVVMREGKKVISPQTGLPIELPGTEVARLRVESQFGEDEVSEGSVCSVTSGQVTSSALEKLYVVESKGGPQ
jgi:curli biogenesis system outer membrane secretion channel CsgG